MNYYNPFQNLELACPDIYRDDLNRFSQTQSDPLKKPSPDDAPFSRYVDLWFLAFLLGAKGGKPQKATKYHKFVKADILFRDSFRINIIEMVAISWSSDPWIINKPAEVMTLANEFATAGFPELINSLTDGSGKPLWNLSDSLDSIVSAIE